MKVASTPNPSSSGRTVNRASSASTVSAPLSTTLDCARNRCTSARAAGPVIHWLSPLAIAVRPSKLMASLARTYGRPLSMRLVKPALSSRASPSSTPLATSIPALRSRTRPFPATCGLGSCMAATTRPTPALTSASAQGGVRP